MRVGLLLLWGLVAASICGAATFQEDFSSDPLQNGWKMFGDTNLFQWDSINQNLEVTWDSSQTNSYFYHSLGTIVAKSDDFSLSYDLQLSDIAIGVNPNKTNTFELVVGFINSASATSTNLERGAGINAAHGARNTCEFDYFPDSGYGATISPTLDLQQQPVRHQICLSAHARSRRALSRGDGLHREQPDPANDRDPQWRALRHDSQRGVERELQ